MGNREDDPDLDGALLVAVDDEPLDYDDAPEAEVDDAKAADARAFLQGVFDRMDLDVRVVVREDDEEVVLDVDGEDAGRAIGKKGQTLDALQFLVNKVVNRSPHGRRHVVVDSGDYRARYEKGLVSMARREAKRAVQQGRVVTLEPMTAKDRRVVHLSLARFPGVSTRSNGEGLDRRLQIIPARGERRGSHGRGGRGPRRRDD